MSTAAAATAVLAALAVAAAPAGCACAAAGTCAGTVEIELSKDEWREYSCDELDAAYGAVDDVCDAQIFRDVKQTEWLGELYDHAGGCAGCACTAAATPRLNETACGFCHVDADCAYGGCAAPPSVAPTTSGIAYEEYEGFEDYGEAARRAADFSGAEASNSYGHGVDLCAWLGVVARANRAAEAAITFVEMRRLLTQHEAKIETLQNAMLLKIDPKPYGS